MTWVLIFWHKVWNCWPERYGKFQSEIPSTSGAICEKPQGGPFGPPPAGRGLITRSTVASCWLGRFLYTQLLLRALRVLFSPCWGVDFCQSNSLVTVLPVRVVSAYASSARRPAPGWWAGCHNHTSLGVSSSAGFLSLSSVKQAFYVGCLNTSLSRSRPVHHPRRAVTVCANAKRLARQCLTRARLGKMTTGAAESARRLSCRSAPTEAGLRCPQASPWAPLASGTRPTRSRHPWTVEY